MSTRLGFPVKVLGVAGLRSHDTRRWRAGPHLSVSLAYLRDILGYMWQQKIRFYRLSSELAPYATHPDLPQFRQQISECERELAAAGKSARNAGARLSVHAGQHVVLNAPDEGLAERSRRELAHQAQLLETMGMGPDAVVVLHVGGVYGDRLLARERFVRQVEMLSPHVRCRLALENDDHRFSVEDCLWVHRQTGLPVAFDHLHFRCHNPEHVALADALVTCLATWPSNVAPKVHFSSPRTATVVVEQRDAMSDRVRRRTRGPRPTHHADYVDPFAFADFLSTAWGVGLTDFDIMLEAKAHDLAVLQLRHQIDRFAPEWSAQLA